MNTKSYQINSLLELPTTAARIKADLKHPLVLLIGDLGTGKTTLTKAMMASGDESDSGDTGSSPSYSLINEYQIGDQKIIHIDLYRLNSPEEAFQLGIEDYLYSGHLCFVEWPQLIMDYIEAPYHVLRLTITENNARIVQLEELT